jgi:fatty acid desaturase
MVIRRVLRKVDLQQLRVIARRLALPMVGLLAALAIVYGAWQVYPPAGWIVAGLLVLADVIHVYRQHTRGGHDDS